MKILYITDTHIRGNNPANRIDNLPETLKNKLREINKIAIENKVDYILHGGDFFDTPSPSLAITGEFLEIFREFEAPIYVISGNHDLFGANLSSLPRTLLGFLSRLGFINILNPGVPIYIHKNNVKLQLTGQPYHFDMDRRSVELDYVVKKGACDVAIHMVHGMLSYEKEFPGDVTLIEQITNTEADITLSGHNHLGFGVIEKDDKHFINPGAVVRLSNHKSELTRNINVCLISLESKIDCKLIPLTSALNGTDVLDRTKLEEKAAMELKLEMFASEIKNVADMERMNVKNIIDEVVEKLGESTEVRKEALKRISIVEEKFSFRDGWD
ncbi:hypothetical protein SYNTR_0673 [Candidatus Syntrophocurvum alkaliphilum]|uniref:Calcineurin-like phosphoesterase domain-containing protein n=1 Tax=Candidatus Syntrophocurvum alkaliphilum TaxID=2293317 RepID=A0A6I6D8B6_9FIRM|nr:metallophosphoesterase [Candidatus Syntrophocurvum alkaliphilum]QGT99266.1 hypothetical protein SYNTR_0673 [Candidatus Syntrophocurvum alkaliphilum]